MTEYAHHGALGLAWSPDNPTREMTASYQFSEARSQDSAPVWACASAEVRITEASGLKSNLM